MPAATVIIPTYNPRPDYLARVLAALKAQTLSPKQFEILLIDNASTPPVALSDAPDVRILREPKPGLRFARECGILAAQSEILFFVDDDNVLAPDYLVQGLELFAAQPAVGAAGGRIIPEFESAPASWVAPHHDLLALRDFGPTPAVSRWREGDRAHYPWCAPLGAGMAVRKSCALAYVQALQTMLDAEVDRQGSALGGAGDNELILCGVLRQGYEVAYAPALRATHLIASRRLTCEHLTHLLYETTLSWSRFRVRHGFLAPIPSYTVPLRMLRAALVQRAWTRAGRLQWQRSCGEFVGRAQATPRRHPNA